LDDNLARAIARDSGAGAGDFVLEVGPGCGFLSVHLAALGARLVAVEVDPRLAEIAARFLAPFPDAEVVVADVLAGKHALEPEVARRLPQEGRWLAAGNLPYSVAAPLLVVLSRLANPPAAITAMLQREMAERLVAEPGGRAWGPLGIRLRRLYDVRVLRRVPPALFWPRPRVDSEVVRLDWRGERVDPRELARLDRLVDLLFQQRRKTLRAGLASALGDPERAGRLLAELGIDPSRRPETLSLETLENLAARSAPSGEGQAG
jgi:16S rRNA (adenine1518-N6/adenine1519-N6)-dimethyltransferase